MNSYVPQYVKTGGSTLVVDNPQANPKTSPSVQPVVGPVTAINTNYLYIGVGIVALFLLIKYV